MGILETLFPGQAARRAASRLQKMKTDLQIEIMARRFEGAAGGRRNDGWRSTGADANADNGPALARLRNRARDLRRNNPYAERAVTGIADNVVGAGIVPRPLGKSRANKKLVELWKAWAEETLCDADGLENFYGLQHKVMEAVPEGGEVLIRRRWRKSSDNLPVPMQLQVLEADFLDEEKNGTNGSNQIIQGIEFSPIGKREAYWLFDTHPGANNTWRAMESRRIPAKDVIHVFLPKRPGQARGYTWFAPVMQRLRNFDEMEDAVMEQAKIAACFAAFVTKDDQSQGGRKSSPLVERVEPGIIQELAQGEDVTFGTPPTFNGYDSYAWQGLHAISVGLGVPYELVTGDLKGVNFSSGRMGWLHFARRVDVWQWRMLIPQLCCGVWGWFMEAQALLPDGIREDVKAEWTPPRRDMVDPKSEIETVKQRLRNGLVTWPDALRELGITDPQAHAKNIQEANALLDELGLILDCDPRKVLAAGAAAAVTNTQSEKPKNAADDEPDA
ncbi:phage portal protein [Pseudomonas nicosulfuronedens]|uniref:phage portal protein n=1 Tax=Pseudomonas nicosulfuronedens TaxID=2571105 RepID=UPI00244CABAF|nr:phage portal protein [Pseudomonas nicosulfuronedens]MDH1011994.1 phage portal protein [Pseudomonas nicosulfuronedens]MDH1980638.1 phage portal protein [Pseudomonas nicosulfuronedens]MDH2027588.1 phage portal protein [Pseudomonas nicosulfuronedens]